MIYSDSELKQSIGEVLVNRAIQEQINPAPKVVRDREALELYQTLFQKVCKHFMPLLGQVTLTAILDRALILTQQKYPSIRYLQVNVESVSVELLRHRLRVEEAEELCHALQALLSNLVNILALLTGDAMMQKLLQEIARKN